MTTKPWTAGSCVLRWMLFTILFAFSSLPVVAQDDIYALQLYKGKIFVQSTNGSPVAETNLPYEFQAIIVPVFAAWVSDGSIETPAQVTEAMTLDLQTNLSFTAGAASQADLDDAYGEGTYTFAYTTSNPQGQSSIPLALGADDFPPVPVVSNIVAAQSVIASNDFMLTFASEADASTNDYVQVMIFNAASNLVFQTGPVYEFEGLSATNTSVDIPAHTLAAGESYTGVLQFLRLAPMPLSFPVYQSGFFSETLFVLQTLSTNGGGTKTNTPPPAEPEAPLSFTGSFLTLTITNGSGSFAASGIYQLFTAAAGSNYYVLGPSGQGLLSGTYTYTMTGSNTATMALSDSRLGAGLLLEMVFAGGGTGTYAISSGADGAQSGTFSATIAYATVTPANFYSSSISNGTFQSYFSGQQGATYTLEKSKDLAAWSTLSTLALQDLSTNVTDATGEVGQFYRARLTSLVYAPASLSGQTLNMTSTGGSVPLASGGVAQLQAARSGNTYLLLSVTGATNGAGTYTYNTTGLSTAVLTYTDSSTAVTSVEQLIFTSTTGGYFYTTNSSGAGFVSGSFNMAAGPVLFFGNAKFNLDEPRGSSKVFPANGTLFSMSVTDAVGYVWTLSIPPHGLLGVATISMTPFTGIDSSQLALPLASGVKLGPEGTEFSDGVTLTLTAPAPLGSHASLLMGKGDGSNLLLVQTTNQGNTYSTTIFHFSSGGVSDPSDPQWNDYVNENLPQAQAAYAQAQSQAQALERPVVTPPEPPDDPFQCSGDNPAADAQVDAYVQMLFAPETTAIQNLLSAARDLVLLTGDDSYGDNAIALAEQVISTSAFRKVNSLFSSWRGSPLKFTAVAKAALSAARQDELLGGPGLPSLFDQLVSWLSGNVINYYWDQLRSQHDYSMAQVLLQIERQIELLGGQEDDSIFQKIASAYTFDADIKINLSGYTGTGGGQFNLAAEGTITIAGDPNNIFPLSGTNTVNYTAGEYYNAVGDEFSLQLPFSYPQRVFMSIDDCTNLNATIYMSYPETDLNENLIEETWNQPRGNPPEMDTYLWDGFGDAFTDDYGNGDYTYDCDFAFPASLQNMQAEAANATFTGSDTYFEAVTVTLTITLQHTPK